MIKQPTKLPSFQFVNPERLSLAVCLAKRDVAKLCSHPMDPSASSVYSEPGEHLVSEHSYKSSHKARLQNDSTDHLNLFAPKYEQPIRRIHSHTRSVHSSQSLNAEPKLLPSQLPPRTNSPPTRDTDCWVPSKSRPPLHAPTEKQLKSAQESQLRQLQNKVARYSAALAEIRGANLEQTKSPVVRQPILINKQNPNRPKLTRISSHQSLKNALRLSSSSLIGPRLLRLRHEANSKPKTDHSVRKVWPISSYNLMKPRPTVSPRTQNATDSNTKLLWEQAREMLGPSCSEFVVLQPERPATPHARTAPRYTHCIPIQHSPQENQPNQTVRSPINQNINEVLKTILHEIDAAEAEEESIRNRWANLNLVDANINLSGRKLPHVPTILINNEQTESARKLETMEKRNFDPMVTSTEHKRLGDSPILFTKPIESSQISDLNQDRKPDSSIQTQFDNLPQYQTLRLPVELHRNLLASSNQKAELQEQKWAKYGGLAVDQFGTIPLVGACEQLANLLVDQSLDQALDLIEKATNDLVEELIKGEMFTEAPDSTHSADLSTDPFQTQLWNSLDSKIDQFGTDRIFSPVLNTEQDHIVESQSISEQPQNAKSPTCNSGLQNILQKTPETLLNETVEENEYSSEFEPFSESCRSETGILTANLNIEQMVDSISDSDPS